MKADADLSRALFISPFQGDATDDGEAFASMVRLLSSVPWRVDYVQSLPERLDGYGLMFLADSPLAHLSDTQITNLQHAVETGSRVVIACNYFFRATVASASSLVGKYGLSIIDDETGGEEMSTNIVLDALTTNVSVLRFHRASPIAITGPNARPLVLAPSGTNSYAAVARLDSGGEIVVLTQSLWWHWLKRFETNSDNGVFLCNVLQAPSPRRQN